MDAYERGLKDGIKIGENFIMDDVIRRLLIWEYKEAVDLLARLPCYIPVIEKITKQLEEHKKVNV